MSLDYTLIKINNYKEICYINDGEKDVLNPVTHSLIFAMIPIGTGAITEDNCAEFYGRLQMLERANGHYLIRPTDWEGKDKFITPEEVFQHIGLETNAGNINGKFRESQSDWLANNFDQFIISYRRHFRNEIGDKIVN